MGLVNREGDGPDVDDEFAHLFRPDSEPVDAPVAHPHADAEENPAPPSDPFSDWEPLVAVPQAIPTSAPESSPEPTPQGGLRFEDPPLPSEQVLEVSSELDSSELDSAELDSAELEGAEIVGEIAELDEIEVIVEQQEAPVASKPDPKAGRLFRSRGAPDREDAVTAIGSMQARRLRTMSRGEESVALSAPSDDLVVEEALAPPAPMLPIASSGEPAPALQVMAGAAIVDQGQSPSQGARPRSEDRREQRERRQEQQRGSSGSLTGLGVYAVTIGVTVILAFGETLFFGDEPGAITGIGLLVVSIFAAFAVRTNDGIHAIFAPPIAFFVASLTAGQVGINEASVTGRAVVVFFLLGGNWIWIVGSTAAALVIVALRRRVG